MRFVPGVKSRKGKCFSASRVACGGLFVAGMLAVATSPGRYSSPGRLIQCKQTCSAMYVMSSSLTREMTYCFQVEAEAQGKLESECVKVEVPQLPRPVGD